MNWLDKYSDGVSKAQKGENIDRYNIDVRRTNMIDYVPYFENVPTTEFDKESVERAKREAERYNEYIEKKYGPQNEYRTAKSAEKAAERLKRLKQTVEVTPITKNKEKQEEKQEEKLETDNKKYNNTTSSKTTNKKQKKKKEKDDEDEGGSGYFPPPFIIDAPNYTGVKPEFYNNVNDESKDDAGVVNTDVFAPSEISYKDYVNINSANYRNAQKLAGSNLGLQLLLNNEKYKKDVDILQKEVEENEYSKILAQEKNKNAVNLGRAVNNIPQAQNGIEGTMSGLTDEGFDYNGAWGGQFQMGGYVYPVNYVPMAQMGGNLPGATGNMYARIGAPSNGKYAKKTMSSAQDGNVIKDDLGQWAHPGEITEIGSNQITMQGVPYPVLGISDTGDTKLMQPGKDYKFKGKKVTEYPLAKDGKELVKLNQLTNFTNYNTKQSGGWLDKYSK